MTQATTFTKLALSAALTAALSTPALAWEPATGPGLTITSNALAKRAGTGPQTRFIVHYKQDLNGPMLMSNMSSAERGKVMQQKADVLSSQLSSNIRFVRSMALAQRHVFAVKESLDQTQARQLMDSMLRADDNIQSIEIDQILRPLATPNDPRYSDQWHYYEAAAGMNLPAAWDSVTGAGTVVAVLDTGYRPHADLVGNILPGYDMINDTFVSVDGDGRDSDAQDPGDHVLAGECGNNYPPSDQGSSWHGTHVAGTVAAVGNNNQGVTGVAYGAKVVPVRVLGKCGGYTSDIADGIIWASGGSVSGVPANANPADVINMSLGGGGACSATSQAAINTARANGATVVVAAGNSNENASVHNPANCDGVITVSALGRDGNRAYYSNYGNVVDVSAPGGAMSFAGDPNGVLSTYNAGSLNPGADNYDYIQGTSMAAPHVAGLVALMYEADPSMTPDKAESLLKSTSRADGCSNCGVGLVDSAAAVAAAAGGDTGGGNGDGDTIIHENVSADRRDWVFYSVDVPAGTTTLTVTTSGGSGDADLYTRFGSQPTTRDYECRPYDYGNDETCVASNPSAGTWHVGIRAYRAFSGLTVTISYE
ncbi:S8 family peptidase [Ferrimonas sp. SCSIO 43195]|uniref:S8 family peptidase n=1 Tax=Ferrimonas sp. SCSIO 43195 TaxID=2822844 RepID=UPI002074D75F|nr:S8 family peptidase [Ferrimonas sp. SCSIO 43195]USD37795.1 S8 family serine peptidase [Ferrimonas sp. SCSIO 43195]